MLVSALLNSLSAMSNKGVGSVEAGGLEKDDHKFAFTGETNIIDPDSGIASSSGNNRYGGLPHECSPDSDTAKRHGNRLLCER